MPVDYNATVVGRIEVAPGLVELRVAPDKRPFEFKSGQYVVLGLKATAPRIEEAGADAPSVVAGEEPGATPGALSESVMAA